MVNRNYVNFEGNERIDLPDFLNMINRVIADSTLLMKLFVSDQLLSSVLKNFVEGPRSANVFTIKLDVARSFYDQNQQWVYFSPELAGTLVTLPTSQGTTNYVQVRLLEQKDEPQTRAFWDTDVGINGEEFFDVINTRRIINENFQINTTGFSGGTWIPLFTVVVDGSGNITSATSAYDIYFKPVAYTLPSNRATVYTDNTVTNFKEWLAYLNAIISEMKNSSDMGDIPYSNTKTMRELENIVVWGGGTLTFEGSFGANVFDFSAAINIAIAGRTNQYSINPQSLTLLNGETAYVTLPLSDTISAPLTISVAQGNAVPISPGLPGQSPGILVLFWRKDNAIYSNYAFPILTSGEIAIQGQDLSQQNRTRLGILTETTFQAYTSTNFISLTDTLPEAISNLDQGISQIFGQIFIVAETTPSQKVLVTNSDKLLFNGSIFGIQYLDVLVDFSGAVINFQTGTITKEDGTTPLGTNFTPTIPPAGQWFWYAVNIVSTGFTAQNKVTVKMTVSGATGPGASAALAPRAKFTKEPKVGQVAVFSSDGVNISAINNTNLVNVLTISTTSGGGGGDDFVTFPAGENLVINNLVYLSPGAANGDTGRTEGSLYLVDAGNANSILAEIRSRALGFVSQAALTGAQAEVQVAGEKAQFTGLITGAVYYADPAVLGGITIVKPTVVGNWIIPTGLSQSATTIKINPSMAANATVILPVQTLQTWPTIFAGNSSELTTAIATLGPAGGGIICMSTSFAINAVFTLPAGVLLVGRYAGTVLTFNLGGQLILSAGSEIRDLKIESSIVGNLILMSSTRAIVKTIYFNVTNSIATTCIRVTGNYNRILECSFLGVVGVGPATGIDYVSGVQNIDRDSIFG